MFPIIDFIFPRVCHICGASLLPGYKYVCAACIDALPRTGYHRQPGNNMEQRFAGLFPFHRASGHFFYVPGSDISSLIQDFKYRKMPGLARHLGHIMGEELFITPFLNGIDYIMPVPMHFIKQARRGYNQTHLLARGLSEATGIPVDLSLKASRPHRTQTSLTHEQRRRNTDSIFKLLHAERLAGRHVLLLDDVCTTGATLAAAATQLTSSPHGISVSLLSLGVTF